MCGHGLFMRQRQQYTKMMLSFLPSSPGSGRLRHVRWLGVKLSSYFEQYVHRLETKATELLQGKAPMAPSGSVLPEREDASAVSAADTA